MLAASVVTVRRDMLGRLDLMGALYVCGAAKAREARGANLDSIFTVPQNNRENGRGKVVEVKWMFALGESLPMLSSRVVVKA